MTRIARATPATRHRLTAAALRRWTGVLLALAVLAAGAVSPGAARADGDPGSDVLVYQSLFVTASAGVSVSRQVALNGLLSRAKQAGVPIRVAIIAHPADLGAVSELWGKPRAYARFLGYELSLSYRQRLLVVMPSGFGVSWPKHSTQGAYAALARTHIAAADGDGLAGAAESAVIALARSAGVTLHLNPAGATSGGAANPSAAPTPTGHGATQTTSPRSGPGALTIAGLAVLAILAAAAIATAGRALARRGRLRAPPARRILDVVLRPAPLLTVGGVVVLAAIAAASQLSSSSSANALGTNPYLDSGTSLSGRPAPPFTLSDEAGRPISLSAYRGKVVFLDFNDSECTTICPLTTTAMRQAQALLGPAGSQIQLLGVDANPKATSIADVLSYSQLHGMLGHWHFLTGPLAQLRRVWRDYHVQAEIEGGLIEHTPALYVIDPQGRLRRVYVTQQSYSAVGQFGQLLAQEASRLLPGHPKVSAHASYAQIPTISPAQTTTVPRAGGGTLALGPGRPRLYLFFATWDQEVMSLGGQLDALNKYAATAAGTGLPGPTAIDEGSVEPSPSALRDLLAGLARPPSYPVGVDTTGRLADGYEVEGQPWFVLASAQGTILWYWNVDTQGWLSTAKLAAHVRAALAKTSSAPTAAAAVDRALSGSPAPLAALHRQAGRLLGSDAALTARLRDLRGYPVVVNAWASWCPACRTEFNLFRTASVQYGRNVAFVGADTDDDAGDAQAFLRLHPVSYPSYETTSSQLHPLLPGGVQGLPITIFIGSDGKVTYIHTGEYSSQGSLNADIQTYAH
ncbi:MAG TPA: redoxin domain-containing protein [Solirubrobacteraceae bacterium]|nr:redoxin domain-containing protein [Solirubrobacteraceae bacterium]